MISVGTNIQSSGDPLQKMSFQQLCDALRNPSPTVTARLRQLRVVQELNPVQYAALKRQLPYFVCAHFNPPYRRIVNFAYTESFVIDIDHLSDKGLVMEDLRTQLMADKRVMMCFTSPGGDGLKLIFKLSERCYDSALYKTFYQLFAERFSALYHLEQAVDLRTCDVARACFMSHDERVSYHPNCEPVRLADYIDVEGDIFAALVQKREVEQRVKEQQQATPQTEEQAPSSEPDAEIMAHIRQTLNPKARVPKAKNQQFAFVPPELESIVEALTSYIKKRGIEVDEVRNINYGKKLRTRLGATLAETNVFYGKRGFSVVQSPRTGTDAGLNALLVEVIESFLADRVSHADQPY